jgi:hypothetical protein
MQILRSTPLSLKRRKANSRKRTARNATTYTIAIEIELLDAFRSREEAYESFSEQSGYDPLSDGQWIAFSLKEIGYYPELQKNGLKWGVFKIVHETI